MEKGHFDVRESIQETSQAFNESKEREEIFKIPLDKIGPNRKNPRKSIDQTYLNELANSIKERGVLEPIIVRKNNDPSYEFIYEIVAGEMRWRASKIAGATTIRSIISETNDIDAKTVALVENFLRKDLTFWETMNALASLREEFETVDALVKAVGKQKRTVEFYLTSHKKIFVYEPLKLLFEEHAKDVDYSLMGIFSPISEKIISHIKKDKRELERIRNKAAKKGLKEAIKSFSKKLNKTNTPSEKTNGDINSLKIEVKENSKIKTIMLHIPKTNTHQKEDIEKILLEIREMVEQMQDEKNSSAEE